jgi:apolipoprotein N-acyltransferase
VAAGAACLGAGALVAASVPPWGWWPLAFVGIALFDRLVAERSRRSRAARAFLFGLGWYAAGMGWMWHFSMPGYLAAICVYAGYVAAATAVAPAGRWRWLGLPAALTLAEALRFCFPFGGVPLASLGIAQVSGPLATPARIGGVILITWLTFQLGCGLSALIERRVVPVLVAIGAAVTAVALAAVAPAGEDSGSTLRMALVQGGGEQGTSALEVPPDVVFERHLAATATIEGPVDVVVWPENVVDVDDLAFADSPHRQAIAAEAARLQAPILVGITEDVGDRFLNAEVVVSPDGEITDRYEKVRRVPFGEYLPLRGLLEAIHAPGIDQLGRDAVPGSGPAVLELPDGSRLGVAISWEIFFGGRVRDGVEAGGEIVTNPTNGASYTGTIVQTQQLASSRLRALETGRWVAQVSPTGFSAYVSAGGEVHQRTTITEQEVIRREVPRRAGQTWYVRLGELPWVALAAVVLGVSLLLSRRVPSPPARA